ncbi:outer membrane protein assembly factor BamE domain-containing protein [Rosenbergiella epipactidis]|uniref:outer membrane protein assembly factor BamE domain-containing protein n=1 Tax=Rosenbergiella epipactidis TaxID=1544694 RepID=UPI001F4D677C|nr:outer membrane protein assembly factor BamE [Rosenbergiella epipactidis]
MSKIRKIIVLTLPFLLSACMVNLDRTRATELNRYSESSIKEKLIIGSSTKKEVLLLLGAPNLPKDYNNASEWVYKSVQIHRGIYLLIPFNNNKDQVLIVKFNEVGVLSSLDYMDKACKKNFK